ncbi:MAG TPA: hypothetical protein PLL77_04395 [Pyrinomonadaceae bacterium]|nr:hypothetical protein [Pyrinomonadaceae bacterium]
MNKLFAVVIFFIITLAACTPYIKYTPGKNISDLQSSGLQQGENTLPSGRKIVVNSANKMDFNSGEPSALVLNYTTSISIDNSAELRTEVDEVWSLFVKDVEAAKLTVGALRPVNGPKGFGFVFRKRDDGTWHYEK